MARNIIFQHIDDDATYKRFLTTERTKLTGIETNATLGATWDVNIVDQPTTLAQFDSVASTKLDNAVQKDGSVTMTGPLILSGTGTNANAAVTRSFVENMFAGLDFQPDIIRVQTDNTLDPGATPATGDRYIITDPNNIHTNFVGSEGFGAGDIVQWNGTSFVVAYDVSVAGDGALVWDKFNHIYLRLDGGTWNEFGGLAGITAGNGLVKDGNTLNVLTGFGIEISADAVRVASEIAGAGLLGGSGSALSLDLATAGGLTIDTNQLKVKLDGTSLTSSSAGLKLTHFDITAPTLGNLLYHNGTSFVNVPVDPASDIQVSAGGSGALFNISAGVVGSTELANGSVTEAKLAASVAGNGIVGGAGTKLAVKADVTGGANLATVINVSANGVAVKIDDVTIGQDGSSRLFVKDSGITSTKIAADAVKDSHIDWGTNAGQVSATTIPLPATGYDGQAANVGEAINELQTQVETHVVTAGDVTSGYFDLAAIPLRTYAVRMVVPNGCEQLNHEVVGATGLNGEFQLGTTAGRVVIRNGVESVSGLSEALVEGDILVITYQAA